MASKLGAVRDDGRIPELERVARVALGENDCLGGTAGSGSGFDAAVGVPRVGAVPDPPRLLKHPCLIPLEAVARSPSDRGREIIPRVEAQLLCHHLHSNLPLWRHPEPLIPVMVEANLSDVPLGTQCVKALRLGLSDNQTECCVELLDAKSTLAFSSHRRR
eukprot:CAMPEP_0206330160 /NCGR_PEP_ID=MMETSP0106_2-20121207/23576_1 /ASSEMBLY_ACC=CAM_ASM_000206 /TAXON_ID=81532 /ORGANISM="Acanthoeca-like sp., Strain 10tr" /LENGTH=160 /DNA_ID=CAMNT_0053762911 /DNA_START=102 /DNA_END=581 /DNA_ORIENTATION=-